jgi:cellulose synthase/poly-beta-1,6-N-acetylglucosamine synthase-like glycosyltransferase
MRTLLRSLRSLRALAIAVQCAWLALSLYQTLVTVVGRARRPRAVTTVDPAPRFFLAVCARNEERVVASIVGDLLGQSYPRELFELVVFAHNCTDDTAAVAERAGARVIRIDGPPGKAAAVGATLDAGARACDYVGVFDADARVPRGFLEAVAAAAPGEDCLQVESAPRDVHEWLVEGYGLGRKVRNSLWWRPRERLGLGTTITGSGWFVRPAVLAELLPGMRTLTEDLELTARLYASGRKVAYVSSTYIQVQEPHRLADSLSQRTRWARGHFLVVVTEWPMIIRRGARGDWRALDMALYLGAPTRMLTRMAATISLALRVLGTPMALPLLPVAAAVCGEWGLPLWVAFRDRLVPPSPAGVRLAARHAVLNVLWFPIGLWALVTPWSRSWREMPRIGEETEDVVAAA